MLTDVKIAEIQAQLWQPNEQGEIPTVYAILGGARDKQIESIIRQGELKSSCLIDGNLTYKMAVAAPYIVRLEYDHPQTIEILKNGWGNSWGIFAITYTPATFISVRTNCRKIAMVKSPEGKNLYFRYYDPRVLRTYFSQCTELEANKVFGQITDIIVESEDASSLHRYRRTEQGVQDINAFTFDIKSIRHSISEPGLLQIRPQQIEAFQAVKFKQFIVEMQSHLTTYFQKQTQQMGELQLNAWVKRNIKNAQKLGFVTELDICRYLNVAIVQGESVKEADWLQEIINKDLFTSTKATLIEEKSLQLLDDAHQAVKQELDEVNQKHLQRFYQQHHKKVLGIGVPLYGLSFSNDEALKAWMYDTGQHCLDLGMSDEMALDIWLDIAMRYGKDFIKQDWAQISEVQKLDLPPSKILTQLLKQQPHKSNAVNAGKDA